MADSGPAIAINFRSRVESSEPTPEVLGRPLAGVHRLLDAPPWTRAQAGVCELHASSMNGRLLPRAW